MEWPLQPRNGAVAPFLLRIVLKGRKLSSKSSFSTTDEGYDDEGMEGEEKDKRHSFIILRTPYALCASCVFVRVITNDVKSSSRTSRWPGYSYEV